MIHKAISLIVLSFLVGVAPVLAQFSIGKGAVQELYEKHYMVCHGENLQGGLGGSLLECSAWKEVGTSVSFVDYIPKGNQDLGMLDFDSVLTGPEILSLEILIDEGQIKHADHSPR